MQLDHLSLKELVMNRAYFSASKQTEYAIIFSNEQTKRIWTQGMSGIQGGLSAGGIAPFQDTVPNEDSRENKSWAFASFFFLLFLAGLL